MQASARLSSPLRQRLRNLKLVLSSYAFRFFLSTSLVLVLIGLAIFFSLFTAITIQRSVELRASLDNEIQRVQSIYAQGGREAFERETQQSRVEYNLTNFYYLLTDSEGNKLAGDMNAWPQNAEYKDGRLVFYIQRIEQSGTDNSSKAIKLMALEATMDDGSKILVARNLRLLRVVVENYSFVLILFLTVSLVLCIGVALTFSVLTLTRLEQFNTGIRRIMRGDLSERFSTSDSNAEPDELARNLNRMLDVITSLMEDIKRVSDNIAHDLRTPLTRHRNHLVSVQRRLGEMEADAVQGLIVETDHILATFNALLRIARIESGKRNSNFSQLKLAQLTGDVIELYEPLAADKNIVLDVELRGDLSVSGDRNLLFQTIANLLDNAIKFTAEGGTISVRLRAGLLDGGTPVLNAFSPDKSKNSDDQTQLPESAYWQYAGLEIADSGKGVHPDNYKKMFQRFYREEQSRSIHPGNGLGLSMVHAAMNLHQGAIYVRDAKPGLAITLVFERTDIA